MFEVHSHFPKDFSTENAVKMDGMFYNAELLGDVNLPEDFSTENVVSMEYMFSRAFLGEGVKFSKGFTSALGRKWSICTSCPTRGTSVYQHLL